MQYRYIPIEDVDTRLAEWNADTYHKEYYHQRRADWRKQGLCGFCGRLPEAEKLTCERCLKRCRRASKRYRQKRKKTNG
jgi:hypothetical protein